MKGSVQVVVKFHAPEPVRRSARKRARTQSTLGPSRQAINKARRVLLREIKPFRVKEIKSFRATPILALEVKEEALEYLAEHPDVLSLEEDRLVAPTLAESLPLIGAVNNMVNADFTGAGQTLVIMDTGVDYNHPDLADKVVDGACFSTKTDGVESLCPNRSKQQYGLKAGKSCDPSISQCDHGTHVAGIASKVAPDANLVAVQVFSKITDPTMCKGQAPCVRAYTHDLNAALSWVYNTLRKKYTIAAINMSLGNDERYRSICTQETLSHTVDALRTIGIATVIASGNAGNTNALAYPACVSGAVRVGGTMDGSFGTIVDSMYPNSNSAFYLDLLAPAGWITSTVPGGDMDTKRGTSMAAPHVAGAWAALKSAVADATVDDTLDALKTTGIPVTDDRDPNNIHVFPRVQLNLAITSLIVDAWDPPDTLPAGQADKDNLPGF